MRSYGQHCALARALDIVGDRWTLLIVRELLIRQPCRYTDLQYGLPGIATNLLIDRLRQLEEHEIVSREEAPPPIATTVYRLTPRGEDLRSSVIALGQWGGPLLEVAPNSGEFRSHWIALPLSEYLQDHRPEAPHAVLEIRTGDQPLVVNVDRGRIDVRPGVAQQPDAVLTGAPPEIMGVLAGRISLAAAKKRGLRLHGDSEVLARVQPMAFPPATRT
jgi:DNA-binding HxlR family transcriptional regulator